MISPSSIRRVDITPLNIPLLVPFGISGGAQAVANNVLIRVELNDGTHGWGEAAPFPAYNGETQHDAITALSGAKPWLIGRDVMTWEEIARGFRVQTGATSGSAQCGLEMALLDAYTRRESFPLWRYYGAADTSLETDMTITTGSPEDAAIAARDILQRGIRIIKVKVGGKNGPAHDLARLRAIHHTAPDSPLILDGNAGLSRTDASELVRGLKSQKIAPALIEQWLAKDDLDGMRALGKESGWLIGADESVSTAADALKVAQAGAAQVINIKLMKAGLLEARAIAEVAKKAGLDLMIGGNVESILAMTASACFAAGLGGFRFADLDTPLFTAENPFEGGYSIKGGSISVAHILSGHGVHPKPPPSRKSGP